MCNCNRFIIMALAAALFAGCGAARKSKTASVSDGSSQKLAPIELPAEVARESRKSWIKTLYLLPEDHPDRRELRDRIIASFWREFEQQSPDDIAVRTELFKNALFLHAPVDFRPGQVSEKTGEMAKWAVKVYEQRGDEAIVLACHRFLMLAEPGDASHEESYRELAEWSESVRATLSGRIQQLTSLIEVYENMIRLMPDREVVEKVAEWQVERHRLVMNSFQKGMMKGAHRMDALEALMLGRAVQTLPVDVIYSFFLAGDLGSCRKYLEGLVADGGLRIEYLELLDDLEVDERKGESYFRLAKYLAPIDARAGLKACILARAADSSDPRFPICVGRSFEELDYSEEAVEFYLEAAEIAPTEEVFAETFELIRRSLLKLHYAERVEPSRRVVERSDVLITRALKKYPDEDSDLRMVAALLLFSMGEVDFDDGRVESATKHLLHSYEMMPNIRALIKLTEVYYLLGDFNQAVSIIERAKEIEENGKSPTDYWQAVVLEKKADLMQALGHQDEASAAYRDALTKWQEIAIPAEMAPAAAIRRGVVLDRLGDLKGSRDAFRLAIRLDPNREATYAELISFLVIRGRLNVATEFYRLAFNQDRIKAMWKIYYSLWVEGLSQRMGKGSFELARGYLETSQGDTWQDKLAGFFSGKLTMDELRAAAANTGQKVEVDYYGAIKALAEGKDKDAKAMLDKVIASNLLGFFEYRMARELLREELGN